MFIKFSSIDDIEIVNLRHLHPSSNMKCRNYVSEFKWRLLKKKSNQRHKKIP